MWIREALAALAVLSLGACSDRFSAEGTGGAAPGGQAGAGGGSGGGGDGGGGSGGASGGGTGGSGGIGGSGGGAGVGGSTGGAAGAATGGSSGDGGSAGGGTAGAPPGCDCGVAQFCRAGMCRDCSDISSLEFGPAEEILDHPASGLRFPRPFSERDALFFTLLGDAGTELWYTDDPLSVASFRLGDATTLPRSGAVPLSQGGVPFELVFDELDGQRIARSGTWDGMLLSNEMTLGSPLSPGGFDTFSIAVAQSTNRYYWMSTRDGPLTLRTGVLGTGNQDLVNLEIPARDGGTCPRGDDDATPWVSANGTLLLFSAAPVDASCTRIDGGAADLYAAALSASSGMPLTPAVALATVNRTMDGSVETDPAFTPDLCQLYFASDGGETGGRDFRLYRALRR